MPARALAFLTSNDAALALSPGRAVVVTISNTALNSTALSLLTSTYGGYLHSVIIQGRSFMLSPSRSLSPSRAVIFNSTSQDRSAHIIEFPDNRI